MLLYARLLSLESVALTYILAGLVVTAIGDTEAIAEST